MMSHLLGREDGDRNKQADRKLKQDRAARVTWDVVRLLTGQEIMVDFSASDPLARWVLYVAGVGSSSNRCGYAKGP
jgi:hypothetical protein